MPVLTSRFSRVCAVVLFFCGGGLLSADERSVPDDAFAVWDFEDGLQGWKPIGCRATTTDGVVKLVGKSNDPQISNAVEKGLSGWQQLSIRARFRGRRNAQIFWSVEPNDPRAYSEEQAKRFEMRSPNNAWGIYTVFFHTDKKITGLRFDPHTSRAQIEIDWVALTSKEPPRPKATPVADLRMPKGFHAELLYSVPGDRQGSWVAMTVDHRGRLITSDQYGKLYRVTPPKIGSDQSIKIEPIQLEIGMAQGLLYAFDSLYVMVNGKGPGLYRVLDTDDDDQFDEVKLLRAIQGGGEHGPHAVLLSPDGKSLYVCGGNHTDLPNPETSRVPRNWDEDQLLGRQWDARGHAAGKLAPGGWICRTDPEGKKFELISSGFRNEYDIAFNQEGELFTYDADMEWDVGSPWYRPTRVNHATSGSEFGWRSGTGKWPVWRPDSLPSVVDIGPGSPTGITFGAGARFPANYQHALFISDWSYGVIYAVHMTPKGASYEGRAERFISAAPLPVTDLVVNPQDGAFYFTIGGRRTQSGLYRVTYVGDESTEPAKLVNDDFAGLRKQRRELERLHHEGAANAIETAWPALAHKDRHIRFAARIAIEHQPVDQWRSKALAAKEPSTLIHAMIALARCDKEAPQSKMVQALGELEPGGLNEDLQLALCRAYALTFIRQGTPSNDDRSVVLDQLDKLFPADSTPLNRELALLLVYLKAPGVVERVVNLQENSPTQEEQIHYAFVLRNLKEGWTDALRKRYFSWFLDATSHRGGASFGGFLGNIRKEAIATLSEQEKRRLGELASKPLDFGGPPVLAKPRKFHKKWTIDELLPTVEAGLRNRSYENGRRMFAAANCFKCHRFAGEGGSNGPDLTGVGRRFNSLNLLESLIEPSKTVSDQYQATRFILDDGRTIVGRVVNLNGKTLMVSANMLDPGNLTLINRDTIEEMEPSPTSLMPTSLLDTLTREEVLDLLAYLRSGGNRQSPEFKR